MTDDDWRAHRLQLERLRPDPFRVGPWKKSARPGPGSTLQASVMRLLRDPEALAAIERLAFLGYSPRQVGLAMEADLGDGEASS